MDGVKMAKTGQKIRKIASEVEELHPLLEVLLPRLPDVVSVEYTHGPDEMGADFIVAQADSISGDNKYVGVVAKLGKLKQTNADVARQVEECKVPRFFGTRKVQLGEVWIVVTDTITKNAKEKIEAKFAGSSLTFINGSRLATLLDKHVPDYWFNISHQVGAYLSELNAGNLEMDRQLSLLPGDQSQFYIPQRVEPYDPVEYRRKKRRRGKTASTDVIDLVASKPVLLIEGDMGSGKSKLARRIISHYSSAETFEDTQIVPVWIPYRQLANEYGHDLDMAIRGIVPAAVFDELQEGSKFLVVIDGVDEKMSTASERLEAIEGIVSAQATGLKKHVVLTSRFQAELEEQTISARLSRYELRPLSFSGVVDFLKALCKQFSLSTRIVEDLKKSPIFRELPKSPISAILLAQLLNENREELPSNLTELYSKYIELVLGRWDIEKGIQSQKEYEALSHVAMKIADYMISNDLSAIAQDEARAILREYLSERNLGLDADDLYERLVTRCEIISTNNLNGTISFKHKTFAEFLFARSRMRDSDLEVDRRAFDPYWSNVFFFFAGLRRDCPELLKELLLLTPEDESQRYLKIRNMADYLLAGYASPYNVISAGLGQMMVEAAEYYSDVVERRIESPLSGFPRIQLLWMFQLLVRGSYSYSFFDKAVDPAAVGVLDAKTSEDTRAVAMFFLSVASIDMGSKDSLDFLLEEMAEKLPLDIQLAIRHESDSLKERSALMKKQDKRFRHRLKGNPALQERIEALYDRPVAPESAQKE